MTAPTPDDEIIRYWRRQDAPFLGRMALKSADLEDRKSLARKAATAAIIGHMNGNLDSKTHEVELT